MRTGLHECDTFSWPSAHPGRRWTCGPHDKGPLEVRIYHPLCLQRCEEVVPLSQSAWRVWPKEGATSYSHIHDDVLPTVTQGSDTNIPRFVSKDAHSVKDACFEAD